MRNRIIPLVHLSPRPECFFDLAQQMVSLVFGPDDRPTRITMELQPLRIVVATVHGHRLAIEASPE